MGTRGSQADLRNDRGRGVRDAVAGRFMWMVVDEYKVAGLRREIEAMAEGGDFVSFETGSGDDRVVGLYWKKRGTICFALVLRPVRFSALSYDDIELQGVREEETNTLDT